MKTASAPLLALLNSKKFCVARLYKISLINGSTLYYTSCDVNISYGGNVYISGKQNALLFETPQGRPHTSWKIGLEVDTLDFEVIPNGATINGQAFMQAVVQGVFDGAEITVSNAYWSSQAYVEPIIPTDVIITFVGRIAEIDASRNMAKINVNSHLELLTQNMPREIYQSGCANNLYGAACSAVAASFATSSTVASGGTASSINATLAAASGYYNSGKITFTSGINAGLSRTIKNYTAGTPSNLTLIAPFSSAPAIGDGFVVYAGCDKTQATCAGRFGNLANFRGFPYIPQNTTAI
ncbi:MAG: DUF2163 domain-containing protein [Pseudomonadota bacterium]